MLGWTALALQPSVCYGQRSTRGGGGVEARCLQGVVPFGLGGVRLGAGDRAFSHYLAV